jgi:hypothetical protein
VEVQALGHRLGVEHVVDGEVEQGGVLAAGLLPPAVEVTARHHLGAHPVVVEGEQGLVGHEGVGPAEPVAHGLGFASSTSSLWVRKA